MDYKAILKSMWKRSKISFVLLAYSLVVLLTFSFLRLGSNLLAYPSKRMESKVRTLYRPSKEEFQEIELFATLTMSVFKANDAKELENLFKGYDDYVVDEYREHRYAILRKGKQVIAVMRGSNNAQNWSDGFTSGLVYDDVLDTHVHSGYAEVSKGVADRLSQYCSADDEIYLTGGSMGGATATLIGWYLDNRGYNVKRILPFANPRVSSGDYGHLPITNVINIHDPVVFLPSFSLFKRYRHQGDNIVYVDGDWYHYDDSWRTDLLTSAVFLKEKTVVKSHMEYPDRLLELKSKLGY